MNNYRISDMKLNVDEGVLDVNITVWKPLNYIELNFVIAKSDEHEKQESDGSVG